MSKSPSPWSEDFYFSDSKEPDTIEHIGNENSGRYPRGSGENPRSTRGSGTQPVFKQTTAERSERRTARNIRIFGDPLEGILDKSPSIQSVPHTAIRKIENKHRYDKFESIQCVDEKGKLLFDASQKEEASVSIVHSQALKMKGQIMTHNHPGTGVPFSPEDLNMIILTGVKECRASGARGTYYMRARPNSINIYTRYMTSGDIEAVYNRIAIMNNKAVDQTRADMKLGIVPNNGADQVTLYLDRLCRSFANYYKYDYGMEEIPK